MGGEFSVEKHAEHDQSSHGDRGMSATGSVAGNMANRFSDRYPSAAQSLRDASSALESAHDAEVKGDNKKAKELARNATRSLREVKSALSGTAAGGEIDEVDRMIGDVKESVTQMDLRSKAKKSDEQADPRERFEKARTELGVPMSEFHSKLSEAIYARWGQHGFVRETYPQAQVVVVSVRKDGTEMGYGGASRLVMLPYDIADDGAISLGNAVEEVQETFEPVGKSENVTRTVKMVFTAQCVAPGEYAIPGLNGEAEMLADAVRSRSEARDVRVIKSDDGTHEVRFVADGDGTSAEIVATVEEVVPRARVLKGTERMRKDAEEKGIITLLIYEPDVVDGQGEFAAADDIEDAAHDYLQKSRRVKYQHEDDNGDELVESWVSDHDYWIGAEFVRKGSWLARVKMSEKSRKLYKAGKINGASMGGYCCVA